MKSKIRFEINDFEKETELLIRSQGTPFIIILILGFVAFTGFLIPPVAFVSSILFELDLGFGFLFTVIIGFGTGFHLTKLVLWNTYGHERFLISNGKVEYYCDFGLFKSNRKILIDNPHSC